MFSRDNQGKDKLNKPVTSQQEQKSENITSETMSKEDLFIHNEDAKKIYEDILSLRKSVDSLKTDDVTDNIKFSEGSAGNISKPKDLILEDTEEIIAAKQAIIQQAKKDAEAERIAKEKAEQKKLTAQQAKQQILAAQMRAARVEEEAEKKRQQAKEAERKAKKISRKKALDAMEAEIQARNRRDEVKEAVKTENAAADAIKNFFEEQKQAQPVKDLEEVRKELISAQEKQGAILGEISEITGKHTEKLAEEQQIRLTQQQILLNEEQAKLQNLLEAHKAERIAREENERALRAQKAKVEKLKKEQKAEAERQEKLAKAKKKQDEKLQKIKEKQEKERLKQEKKEAAERARLERERLEKKSKADAEIGGGIVNVKGVKINTKIKDTLHISLKDLIGLVDRKERKEKSEEAKQQLKEERELRTEAAREVVDISVKKKLDEFENSHFGKRMRAFKNFCEHHKRVLLVSFAAIMLISVGFAGVLNYYTAYEYSYNGKILGLVKQKDDVLRITDLVQNALTEDKNVDVIIDAKDDIEFKRVAAIGDVDIDTSEEVLKRLTYMGDLNVKAYGIYVDGKKVGSVESKEIAANVMQDIKDKYASKRKGAEIEEAVFVEKVDVRKSNTDLQDVSSEKEMVDILCTSGKKVTNHQVVKGETLADIAKLYGMSEEDVLEDNPNVDPKKLTLGSTLVLKQNAPVLTVKITEMVTYEKKIEFETKKKDSDDIYKGDTQIKQEGKDGLSEITSRIVLVNGEETEEIPLVTTVKKKPVDKIVLVGTKKRPPTVGSGKYKWPLSGGYTLTSPFGSRWGRHHDGIDLGVPVGSNVMAADGGTVTFAGYSGAYGYLVIIDHQNGMETRYAHNSQLLVSTGTKVYQGQHIAESGNTGRSTGPHLHFEIRVGGAARNPLSYLP